MKVNNIVLVLTYIILTSGSSLQHHQLNFITDYPIKIDGGCSFYTYRNVPLSSEKYILVISSKKEAFFTYNNTYVYLRRIKRIEKSTGYTEEYSNKKLKLTLCINQIQKTNDFSSIRTGTFKLIGGKNYITFNIHGKVEEIDKYNSPTKF